MAAVNDDPEIGSLNAHVTDEPAQAVVMTPARLNTEVKNNVLAVMPHFYGRKLENPYTFLHEFCKLCGIQKRSAGSSETFVRLEQVDKVRKSSQETIQTNQVVQKRDQAKSQSALSSGSTPVGPKICYNRNGERTITPACDEGQICHLTRS